jgi:carboxymethylenebutenolidase
MIKMRSWLRSVLAVAALAAAMPSAATQAAGTAGSGRAVEFQAGDETVKAYVALPADSARGIVVVTHEWWGLNDQIRGVADRLAAEGYAAIAPDLYRGEVAVDPERAHELMRGLQDARAGAILRAAAAHLRASQDAVGRKAAVMGFCMGGRQALLAALGEPGFAGVVMFYGTPVLEKDKLAALSAPVLGLFGADDKGIPIADVKAFEATARAAGKSVDTHLYMGAGHAFFNEARPSYNKEAAADAWKRTLAFMEKSLSR